MKNASISHKQLFPKRIWKKTFLGRKKFLIIQILKKMASTAALPSILFQKRLIFRQIYFYYEILRHQHFPLIFPFFYFPKDYHLCAANSLGKMDRIIGWILADFVPLRKSIRVLLAHRNARAATAYSYNGPTIQLPTAMAKAIATGNLCDDCSNTKLWNHGAWRFSRSFSDYRESYANHLLRDIFWRPCKKWIQKYHHSNGHGGGNCASYEK